MKYVPAVCYVGTDVDRFYQYTVMDEASRERFIYAYKEQSGYSTVDFIKRAIIYLGYAPETIQTDHGAECTRSSKTDRHRNDQERFYNHLSFYSYKGSSFQ